MWKNRKTGKKKHIAPCTQTHCLAGACIHPHLETKPPSSQSNHTWLKKARKKEELQWNQRNWDPANCHKEATTKKPKKLRLCEMAPSLYRHREREGGRGAEIAMQMRIQKSSRELLRKPSLGQKQEEEVRILTENQLQDACDHHPMHRWVPWQHLYTHITPILISGHPKEQQTHPGHR